LKHKPASDSAVGEEENPEPVPPIAVLLDDLLLVADPVLIPAIDCGRVMYTKDINVLDLKSSTFQLIKNINKKIQRATAPHKPCL